MSNTFGSRFRLTTFGESHGTAIGGVVDGCPAGLILDLDHIQSALDRRKPGQNRLTTQRKETDCVQLLSGVFEGKTTGAPIGFMIPNTDARSADYDQIQSAYRPSHADYTYDAKYGMRDHRGGGRSSARETACRVVGGAIAQQFLTHLGVAFSTYVERIHTVALDFDLNGRMYASHEIEASLVRCPHPETAQKMEALIDEVRSKGDTVGGSIRCIVFGLPAGWGQPVFNKLHADLGAAMLGINAVKGFEYGSGVSGTYRFGSEENDAFELKDGKVKPSTNRSGGIQGGISNGADVSFSVAFKPVATLMQDQHTVDSAGKAVVLEGKGRHDPCVLPRAVPIVEAMAALVLADHALLARADRL